MKQLAILLPLLFTVVMLQGCHGNNNDNNTNLVRLVNATNNSLDMVLAVGNATNTSNATNINTVLASGVTYGNASTYSTITSGSETLELLTHGSNSVPLFSTNLGFSANTYYTLLAYNSDNSVHVTQLIENQLAPAVGSGGMLRIIDLSADAGTLDIYIAGQCVPSTTVTCNDTYSPSAPSPDLAAVSQAFVSNISGSTGYYSLPVGTYHIWAVGGLDSTRKDLRFDLPNVVVGDTQVLSLVLTSAAGGVLLDGMILQQESTGVSLPVVPAKNTFARVRIASNFSDGVNVNSATANGSTVLTATQSSPGVGAYALITPNSSSNVSFAVNNITPASGVAASGTLNVYGAPVAAGTATVLPGTDNTLLVVGSSTAPQYFLIADDNTRPLVGGSANLRVVNGVNGETSGLALNYTFIQLVSSVAFGSASPPQTVTTGSNTNILTVNNASYCGPDPAASSSCNLSGVQLVSQGIYTMFVLGNSRATGGSLPTPYPYGILVKDH